MKTSKININSTGVTTESNRLKDSLAEENAQAVYKSLMKTFLNTFWSSVKLQDPCSYQHRSCSVSCKEQEVECSSYLDL